MNHPKSYDWEVIRKEELQVNSQTYLSCINGKCLEALKKGNCKVRFGGRNVKKKIFRSLKANDDLKPADTANKLLEETKIDGPKEIDEPAIHAEAEGSADKSEALEVHLG